MNESIRLILDNLENNIRLLRIQLGESENLDAPMPSEIMPITDILKAMNSDLDNYTEPEYYEEP